MMIDPNSILAGPRFRQDRLTLEAAWRFQIVAPMMAASLTKPQRQHIRARILAEEHTHPWRGRVRVSERSLRRWCAQYRKSQLPGLVAKRRNDRGCNRSIPPDALSFAEKLKRDDPRRPVEAILEMLAREKSEWEGIRRSTLDRQLRRLTLPERQRQRTCLMFEAAAANSQWQGDILHGSPALHEGKSVKAKWVCWLDDHSRRVMDLQAFPDERFPVIEASLKRAILKYGRPERILVDNGKVYSGHALTLACSQLGIHKIHAAPYRPQTKGKVEKFFQLFRRRFLNEIELAPPQELERLNQLAAAWLERYHQRPHRGLEGKTPEERYQPPCYRSVTLQALEESFWQWEVRKVSVQGRIEFYKGHYYVDASFSGQTVIVRYDPFDLSRIVIWRDGRPLTEATATKLTYLRKPRRLTPSPRKSSDASERFLDSLEQAQLERIQRELNLIELPEEADAS
jgi:transposase InsO family protein